MCADFYWQLLKVHSDLEKKSAGKVSNICGKRFQKKPKAQAFCTDTIGEYFGIAEQETIQLFEDNQGFIKILTVWERRCSNQAHWCQALLVERYAGPSTCWVGVLFNRGNDCRCSHQAVYRRQFEGEKRWILYTCPWEGLLEISNNMFTIIYLQ